MESRQVGSFDKFIHRGEEAIKRSKESIQHSQEQREAQSRHIDSLIARVLAVGLSLSQLLLGGPFAIAGIISLSAVYFKQLADTQTVLADRIQETEAISEGLKASNEEVQNVMVDVDLTLDELYFLLFEQDYATESLRIEDAALEDPQPPWQQVMEETDAEGVGVHQADQFTFEATNFCLERHTSGAAEPHADQGKETIFSSGHATSPDPVQDPQSETMQLLRQQVAILEDQKYQLSTQLELIGLEVKAQQEALKVSEGQIRDLRAREREAERERRRRQGWCFIL